MAATTETATGTNPLKSLLSYGQSVWLDYIRRDLMTTGELKKMIEQDGLRGMTSNPAIFEKAILSSDLYNDLLGQLASRRDLDAKARYEQLALRDIQDAADALRPVYDSSKMVDGYVSLEVSPYLAHDTEGTIAEAKRLWAAVKRPNVMIKIPGTAAGIPAITEVIGAGINVNVTLLFAQDVYEAVAHAYIAGLEKYAAANSGSLGHIASVASFFVSRIDSLIDSMIDTRLKANPDAPDAATLKSLQGKVAIANAKLAYQAYGGIFSGAKWDALKARGAQVQRLLWASTGTKNPAYSDVLYVDELIGPDTVNTVPPATFDAFRDHGKLRNSLTEDVAGAQKTMNDLAAVGISIKEVTDKLTVDAVRLFNEPFDKLLAAIEKASAAGVPAGLAAMTASLPADLDAAVKSARLDWRANGKVRRLWQKDAALWSGADEASWLGWLDIVEAQIARQAEFAKLAADVRDAGFQYALLLGMGGSSLGPEVLQMTFGNVPGAPELHVLDSTDPAQVATFDKKVDLAKTVCIVASKSGSTLEPNIFKQYFFQRMVETVGAENAGKHFIAITDPGSKMQQVAEGDHFRHIFFGRASIGGRYSALSDFGMVPAAVMGLDTAKFLGNAQQMVEACGAAVAVEQNPGVALGTILGCANRLGRDKVTIIASPAVHDLGAWLEQLIAESTGKEGHGIIPVDREALAEPAAYGSDRVFAYVRYAPAPDAAQDAAVSALEAAGQPVIRIAMDDTYQLGAEFFRWEIATAVAGSIMGINPFNQPDVEASKIATRALTSAYEQSGSLPAESPILEDGGIQLYTDEKNAASLKAAAGSTTLAGYLKAHLGRIGAGDYFAVLGYIEMNEAHEAALQQARHAVRDAKQVATCLGFGPRFLHSTGQAYKGGPNSGVFLQVTCDDAADLAVPGNTYTFGVVKAAQARGDFQVLADRGRRALRVHLGKDVAAGLATLNAAVKAALA